jgi:hypothetical protein
VISRQKATRTGETGGGREMMSGRRCVNSRQTATRIGEKGGVGEMKEKKGVQAGSCQTNDSVSETTERAIGSKIAASGETKIKTGTTVAIMACLGFITRARFTRRMSERWRRLTTEIVIVVKTRLTRLT